MAVSACRPPATVNLGVVLPADAALRPASLLVRVIEPQAQRPFGCEDLAFGLVPEVVLGLTEQGRQQFAAGQATSLELLRTGDRLLLVEGLDREGVALAKGCTALGTITGPTQLSLRLEPVVRLGGQPVPERLNLPTGGSIPQVVLPIVDLLGRPASGVTARWYLAGAASATGPRDDQGPVEPSVGGLLTVRASNPLQSGPFIVLVAPRWGSAVSIGGMVTPASVTTEFPAGVQLLDFVAGRVGPVGEHGFTALTQVDGGTSHLVVYRADGGLATVGGPGPMAPGAWRLTLLEDSASGRDTAVAINQDTWVELPAGSVSPRPFLRLPAAPSRVMPLWEAGDQSCALPPGLFLAMLQNGERRVFNRAGGAVPDTLNLPGAVLATGCVAQVEGGTFAAAVVDVPFQSLYLFRFARGQLPAPQPVQLLALQTGRKVGAAVSQNL